jgi:hypothetical protein
VPLKQAAPPADRAAPRLRVAGLPVYARRLVEHLAAPPTAAAVLA